MNGDVLKHFLKKSGKTQQQLAESIGITQAALTQQFQAKDVRTGTIEKFCRALGLKINDLYKETDLYDEKAEENAYEKIDPTNEEIIRLRAENDVLRELVGLKGKDVKHAV